jgi:hypothetical protein
MTDTGKPNRLLAAIYGAVELLALDLAAIALFSMGGDGLDRMFAAYVFIITAPVAAVLGAFLGIRSAKSVSPWGYARPRQVIISVLVAFLLLGFNSLFQEMGLIHPKQPTLLKNSIADASLDQLTKSLHDPMPQNRAGAAEELVRRRHPASGDLILPLLQDSDAHVRERSVVLLGQLRDKRAVPGIISLLDDPDYGVQLAAVRSLGEIGDKRAVAPLITVLDRQNFGGVVAEALSQIGDRRAVGPLIDFLDKAQQKGAVPMQNLILSSLEKLSDQHFGNDMARWQQWYETEGRK